MFGVGVLLCVWGGFVFFAPNFFGEPDNYIPADPLITPAHIVPEWYFLPFYAILRSIPSKLGGVIAMFTAIFVFFLLPWLDTSKIRSARFRPIYKYCFWLLVINCFVLGWAGGQPPEGIPLLVGRLATAYYFLHFFILIPTLGKIETPIPLPKSIDTHSFIASANDAMQSSRRK
jgi:ubiquinol-cytochrome c reductase cytochrome b/c1 subunit